ncbi:LysR family transcriptional regulator ArgP [Thalassotalea sp. PLHSN55]|uniref:LysR family transcriptional regulator ArgP n=1 Tax=Thalassotalea sp. PLHSN55 TaxID=3435888 RepID=UPI003F85625D
MLAQIDYKLLHALATVVKTQSFERAADRLCITQSAVSQRIKLLEQHLGQAVIIRGQPLHATEVGKKLVNHFYQVAQLEADLLPDILNEQPDKPLTIHLATNADSLATWLIPAIAPTVKSNFIELDMLVEDEKRTVEKLKSGEAFGAIGLAHKPIKGCQSTRLGNFNYIVVASKEFRDTYFKAGINATTLKKAPGVAFDHKDNMHIQFVEQQYGLKEGEYPLHTVRSSEAFANFAMHGAAYCLIAELQIHQELASGKLINLLPDYKLVETLYWHRWALLKGVHKKISEVIINTGQRVLS